MLANICTVEVYSNQPSSRPLCRTYLRRKRQVSRRTRRIPGSFEVDSSLAGARAVLLQAHSQLSARQ